MFEDGVQWRLHAGPCQARETFHLIDAVSFGVDRMQRNFDPMRQQIRRLSSAQALAVRYRIVLACAEGLSNTAVARQLPATIQTVGKWRVRFVAMRLAGLLDEPRPGALRKNQRCGGRAGAHADSGKLPARRYALVHALAGYALLRDD